MNTKEKLIQLLELCIEKGLNFDYSQSKSLCISFLADEEQESKFYHYVGLYEFWTEKKIHQNLDDLITKVKNYQP